MEYILKCLHALLKYNNKKKVADASMKEVVKMYCSVSVSTHTVKVLVSHEKPWTSMRWLQAASEATDPSSTAGEQVFDA